MVRHVLVPGLTLEDVQLRKLGRLLQHYSCIERVELLPFHKMGEYKWEELGEKYTLSDTQPPTPEQVEHAAAYLKIRTEGNLAKTTRGRPPGENTLPGGRLNFIKL